MKSILITGIALALLGAAALGYDHYSYTTRETVLQVGPITATADRTRTVSFPPILGWMLLGGGVGMIGFAVLSKKN